MSPLAFPNLDHSSAPEATDGHDPLGARTRVKWENVLIGLVGVTLAISATVIILTSDNGHVKRDKPAASGAKTDIAATAVVNDDLTLDEATGLVTEARDLMGQARWNEAADRLAYIPEVLRVESGAAELAALLEGSRERWTTLTATLAAQIEATQWQEAKATVTELLSIATTPDVTAQDTVIDEHLGTASRTNILAGTAPATAAAASTKSPSITSAARPNSPPVTGGGAASAGAHVTTQPTTTKPSSAKPSTHATSTAKPAASSGSATGGGSGAAPVATPGPSTGSSTSRPTTQAQLQQAIAAALAGTDGGAISDAQLAQFQAQLDALVGK